jgi:hypothetical protein
MSRPSMALEHFDLHQKQSKPAFTNAATLRKRMSVLPQRKKKAIEPKKRQIGSRTNNRRSGVVFRMHFNWNLNARGPTTTILAS